MPAADNLTRTLSQTLGSKKQKVSSELDPYLSWARWIARTEDPFVSLNTMFHLGMHQDASVQTDQEGENVTQSLPKYLEDLSEHERKQYLKLWAMLKAYIPSLEARLPEFHKFPTKLQDLISKMTKAAGNACSQDAFTLREAILIYVAQCSPRQSLEPLIKTGAKKCDTRGWKHPMLARLLCPVQYLEEFDEDPKGTMKKLEEGSIPFTADDFPAFMYVEGSFDPDNVLEGLFMHPLPIIVAKHLLCCPSSALKPVGTSLTTKAGQAKKHEFRRITERTIAYAMFQTFWGLCSQDDLRLDEGDHVKQLYFQAVVDTLVSDVVDKAWVNKILDYWTEQVLGPTAKKSGPVQRTVPSIRDAIRSQQRCNLTVATSGGGSVSGPSTRNAGINDSEIGSAGGGQVAPSSNSNSRSSGSRQVPSGSDDALYYNSQDISTTPPPSPRQSSGGSRSNFAPEIEAVTPPVASPKTPVRDGSPLTDDEDGDEVQGPVVGKGKGKAPAKENQGPAGTGQKRKGAAGNGEGEPAKKKSGRGGKRGGRGRGRK